MQVAAIHYDFWDIWTDITPIEKKAIEVTIRARDKVISSVPKEELIAIYVKGSFVRREMNEGSDVDMVPIVLHTSFEGRAFGVNDNDIDPVMVVPLSIEEFESNELATKSDLSIDLRAKPDRFLRMLDESRIIFGQKIEPGNYPIRSDAEAYKDEIEIILNGYVPQFLEGKIDFSPLLKEFFWMTEMELASKGVSVPHTFLGIAEASPASHLIHEALRLRESGKLDRESGVRFVQKLQEFLR